MSLKKILAIGVPIGLIIAAIVIGAYYFKKEGFSAAIPFNLTCPQGKVGIYGSMDDCKKYADNCKAAFIGCDK